MSQRVLLMALSAGLLAAAPPPLLNDKVLLFARDHVGQTVGRGECFDLPYQALRNAGARRFPPYGHDADYVWGERLDSLDDLQPGDVLQFRDVRFRGRKRFRNGAVWTWTISFPHHTAIVAAVKRSRSGLALTLLHQNVDVPGRQEAERKQVQETRVRMADRQPGGWIRAYRPVPE